MIRANVVGGRPLFDLSSYARRGPGRRDRLSPAEVALISRTVRGSPEVMVKVLTRGAANMTAVRQHLSYVGRDGKLALETEDGERLQAQRDVDKLPEQWDLDLEEHRRNADLIASKGRKPSKLVHKLMLSMPAGTSADGVLRAARSFLREEFGDTRRYAFVLHTDVPHPHVHVVLKAVNERGVRLHINKCTLSRWREGFAAKLRAQDIDANATSRAVRGQSGPTKCDSIFRAARRGNSTHLARRVQAVVSELSNGRICVEPGKQRLLSTRKMIETSWRAIEHILRGEDRHELARDVQRYVNRMLPSKTEKEALAADLIQRVHTLRARSPPYVR